ncbi:alpha/beta hydrolase [Allosphingosinicella flava]|uniref:Alpha/beta hydrolase n=1 Tax=Allosphingosinicella flava TaxID=2771430 RepID=A0A7T2GI33_9SPHN|nr:alpha/beta hydrolase [Sphingosinicella flava]QPQ54282.1 alpha/beta hydrolase [Sphingosinicella flava]
MTDDKAPPKRLLLREGLSLISRFWRGFGHVGERGPADGQPVFIIPGFLANDRTTLGLQRAFAKAGYRVTGWGMGMNRGARNDTLDILVERLEIFAKGRPVIVIGWSLGGIYAREVAKRRPDLIAKVVTLGSPFSGSLRANNAWRIYELVAGHPVDAPPIDADIPAKPPVPTLALWSRRDGVVAPACSRGLPHESDQQVEIDCTHMGFGVDGKAYPKIVEAVRDFT